MSLWFLVFKSKEKYKTEIDREKKKLKKRT